MDHSGALVKLMERIPNTPIYCTANCVKSLRGQYHKDWNFNVVKTGDKLDLGNGKELVFVEMAMLHWPDSMACYMTQDNILLVTMLSVNTMQQKCCSTTSWTSVTYLTSP